MSTGAFDAVILAGGQGSRMGHVSKADLQVSGERLLDTALGAARGAAVRVVVGDVAVPGDVVLTREDPPGTGPAAGLLAGLDAVASPAPWTLVLAVDLPDARAAVARLLDVLPEAPAAADGLCLRDAGGELQHLTALYRTDALRRAFAAWGDPANRSVRGVMAALALLPVDPGDASVEDLDTPEQLARWIASHPQGPGNAPSGTKPDWRAFVEDACAGLDLDAGSVDEHAVLRLARRVAHGGARPMAPIAAYILGLALASPTADPVAVAAALTQALDEAPAHQED